MEVEIHTEVFNRAYLPYLQDVTPFQIYFGGSSSGKSVFLAQRAVFDLLQGGRNYLVCRQVGKSVRGSVAQEIWKVIKSWGLEKYFRRNKTDGTITCIKNGYQAVFTGLDDVEKLKSITPEKGEFTDTWVEEATETEIDSLRQLEKRQRGGSELTKKRIVLSFNPILQTHWIYTEYFSKIAWGDDTKVYRDDNILVLHTTYLDNKFLTTQDRERLQNEKDPYYYAVYTLGKWGILGDVIFINVHVKDLDGMRDQFTNTRYGLDFGFAADPAAMPLMHYDAKKKEIYIWDELYEHGLTNDLLAEMVKGKIAKAPVVCDSAEPKSIAELQNYGVTASPAKKGKDSVNFGVQWLQQQTIYIDTNCVNAKREFTTYHWKKDKNGNSIKIPAGGDDHLIDASRYGLEMDMDGDFFFSA